MSRANRKKSKPNRKSLLIDYQHKFKFGKIQISGKLRITRKVNLEGYVKIFEPNQPKPGVKKFEILEIVLTLVGTILTAIPLIF
jgi:hypothetical protein